MFSLKNKKINIFALGLTLAAVFMLLSGCKEGSASDEEATVSFEAMDTYMTITVYGSGAEEAANAAKEEIERLDSILSAEDEESEIYEINASQGGTLSEDCAFLIEASISLYEETGGAFDITIYPVAELWGFTTGSYAVPSEEELKEALSLVGTDALEYDKETSYLSMDSGMAIGLGGIAKGYSGECLKAVFEEYAVTGAIASLGGNIVVYGTKPSGDLWNIAIQDPEDTSEYACVLSLEGGLNVVTSGGYERYFEEDGAVYHHIIDPETGYPSDSGLASVSIISEDGTSADGLSTALFVIGLEEAVEFWRTNETYDFEMVLIDEDGIVYITEGLADSYSGAGEAKIISR